MVTLNGHASDAQALDAVRIDGTLSQPFGISDFLGLSIEHLDEVAADNLTFLLRVGDTFEVLEEAL